MFFFSEKYDAYTVYWYYFATVSLSEWIYLSSRCLGFVLWCDSILFMKALKTIKNFSTYSPVPATLFYNLFHHDIIPLGP